MQKPALEISRAGFVILLYVHDGRRVAPQFFELIKVACARIKDVDDHIPIVQEHPARFRLTVHAERQRLVRLHLFLNFVDDRLDLPLAGRRRDDKVISEGGEGAEVQQDDIRSLLVRDNFCNVVSLFV